MDFALLSSPIEDMTLTIMKPTTSSSIAAVTRTVPALVLISFSRNRIAHIIPNEVDDSAAPDAIAVRLSIVEIGIRRNDRRKGKMTPVAATRTEGMKFCLSNLNSVLKPPVINAEYWAPYLRIRAK
jgi:hypothetical protein